MQFEQIWIAFQAGVAALPTTLLLTVVSMLIGVIFGLAVGLVRYFNVRILSPLFRVIITVLKGVPAVLILLVAYLIGSNWLSQHQESGGFLSSFNSYAPLFYAIIALSVIAIVNASEIFRGALYSIDKGQFDAADAIGMTTMQSLQRIILPQLFPVALPMLSNLLISLLKATALSSMITVVDVLMGALITANNNYKYLEAYIGAALVYWIISILIEQATKYLESRRIKKMKGITL